MASSLLFLASYEKKMALLYSNEQKNNTIIDKDWGCNLIAYGLCYLLFREELFKYEFFRDEDNCVWQQ